MNFEKMRERKRETERDLSSCSKLSFRRDLADFPHALLLDMSHMPISESKTKKGNLLPLVDSCPICDELGEPASPSETLAKQN